MSEKHKTSAILTAIHAVMLKVGYVQKLGKNEFHKYRYAGEADLLAALRPAILEAGLILLPSQRERTEIDAHGNIFVAVDYTLAHKDGEVWPEKLTGYGAGNDKNSKGGVGDKGLYKALTGANKYMLFKLFQIETGDDPEVDNGTEKDHGDHAEKKPPGITAARAEVTEMVRELNACADGDTLMAFLGLGETKRTALKICDKFPSEWVGPEKHSGLRGQVERVAEEHGVLADAVKWLNAAESVARGTK